MTEVFVVMGVTGEYSDRTEWPVVAYLDRKCAEQHVEAASARARELEQWRNPVGGDGWHYTDPKRRPTNEHDPDMRMYYTGTYYYVLSTELKS